MFKSTDRRQFLQRASGVAIAAVSNLAFASGQNLRVETRFPPVFVSTPGGLSKGTFQGTAIDQKQQGIVLRHLADGTYTERGTYISSPIAIEPESRLKLSWRERWTTPVVWEKDVLNPILTPAILQEPSSLIITTPCVMRAANHMRLYFGLRPGGLAMVMAPIADKLHWEGSLHVVLTAGPKNAFDGGGVNAPYVVPLTDRHWRMYYVGYHPTARWGHMPVHQIGLAESEDGGLTWRHTSNQPVIPHGPPGSYDAFAASAGTVLRVGREWWMWYGGIRQVPYLASICLATSKDGRSWQKYSGNPVLRYDPRLRAEAFVVAKPCVLHEEGLFKMWYSAVGFGFGSQRGNYHICYAESRDGVHWDRFPGNPVVTPSSVGWDHEMVEYPSVLHDGKSYQMWFCGDKYSSIGHARGRKTAKIKLQARTGSTPLPSRSWSDWGEACLNPMGTTIVTGKAHWLQIRATLQTESRNFSPIVQDIRIVRVSRESL